MVRKDDLDLELRVRVCLHVVFERDLGGHDRSLATGVGIEARLIVEDADFDMAVERGLAGLAERGRLCGEEP